MRENISRLREEIEAAAIKSGRRGSDIQLVAATKTQNPDTVRQAVAAGVDACGENRVQELTEKSAAGAYTGKPVHFIGHLQKNKIKKVVGTADLIQSVDSLDLLRAIDREAERQGLIQDTLIQVNIGSDPNKYGISAGELSEFLDRAGELVNIRARGLMTILPISDNSSENRRFFAQMFELFVDIRAKTYDNISMDFLSMGMSGDFADAICEGANMIRVGSRIFGSRNYT